MAQDVVIRDDAGVEHVFPAGFDPQRAIAIVKQQSKPDVSGLSLMGMKRQGVPEADVVGEMNRREGLRTAEGASLMPTVGGTIGGIVGNIPGAALGGGLGEAVKQTVLRGQGDASVPPTMGGQLADMGKSAAVQGVAEGAGRLLSWGARKLGGALYRKALAPLLASRTGPVLGEAEDAASAIIDPKGLVATGLKEGIPVDTGGALRTGRLIGESKDAATAMVQAAERAPGAPMIDPLDTVGGITTAVENARGLDVAKPHMKAIGDYARAYLSEHPAPMPLTEAHESMRTMDRFYDKAYRKAIDKSNPITVGSAAAAVAINNEKRNLLRQAVPGLAEQNVRTQQLVALEDAIKRRLGNVSNWQVAGMRHLINAGIGGGVGAVGGQKRGLETFAVLEALSHPASASRIGIGLSRATVPLSSAAVRTALLGLMRSHGQTEAR